METERWLPVVGWESLYEVSDLGRVRSLDRFVHCKNGQVRRHRGALLTMRLVSRGHHQVVLSADGLSVYPYVHRLVLEAFVGRCPEGMEGCHNNGDPADNRLSNIRWDTHSSNQLDRNKHGTSDRRNRTHCPRRHPLAHPNLVAHKVAIDRRSCLACRRAQMAVKRAAQRGILLDLQAMSDWYYAKISAVDAAAGRSWPTGLTA